MASQAVELAQRNARDHDKSADAIELQHGVLANRVALQISLGDTQRALVDAKAGVELARRMVKEFGPSEFRLRRLATSLAVTAAMRGSSRTWHAPIC